jgi:protein O-GlcNAc transferase
MPVFRQGRIHLDFGPGAIYDQRIDSTAPIPADFNAAQQALRAAVEHHRCGRLEQAIAAYEWALVLAPDRADAQNNLGVACKDAGRLDQAMAAFRRAIELAPNHPEPWNNLGNAFRKQGKLDDAIAAYHLALNLAPANAQTHSNLGAARKEAGDIDQASASSRQAVLLNPSSPTLHSNLLYALHFHPGSTPQSLLEEHQLWDQRHGRPLPPSRPAIHRQKNPKFRIGYVSPDFGQHVVGRFMVRLIVGHDRGRFEITCYSNALWQPNPVTEQLRASAHHWREIGHLSDHEADQLIRSDGIDILVDLSAHMAGNRLPLFAKKPAPIQVSYLAYCGTTGLSAMDYRLTDPYFDPEEDGNGPYTERSIRLPSSYWCYKPPDEAAEVFPPPSLATGQITFGSLNSFAKVNPGVLATWARILGAVPGSRLLIHALEGAHRRRAIARFTQEGIDPQRITFVGFTPLSDYFERYNQIDIALDPFPYAGGTTTLDAFWMGVPVITLSGQTAVGRGGVSILSNLGLRDLIASTTDQYVDIARALAQDRPRLASLRNSLRQRLRESPLMDAASFVGAIESAFLKMQEENTSP